MGCIYKYKGLVFQSELQLDDFLIEKYPLVSKYPDLAFSKSVTLSTYDTIMQFKKESEDLKYSSSSVENGKNDIEPTRVTKKNHIGVNDFLKGLKTLDGDLLFPEFILENYWKEIRPRWAGGKFDPEEAEAIFGKNQPTKPIIGDAEFDQARQIIEDKWKAQGQIGSELHKVLQKYFSKTKDGKFIKDLNDDFLINNYLPSQINTDLVPPKVLKSMLQYCRDLEKQLKEQFGENLIFIPEVPISGVTKQLDEQGNPKNLLGVIDLLVLDSNGVPHIVDYKTSPRPYIEQYNQKGYNSAKVLAFKYQLGVYERLLKKYGINTSQSKLFIAPIQLSDFSRDNNNNWTYSGVKEHPGYLEDLTYDIKNNLNLQENIDEFLPAPFVTNTTTDNMLEYVTNIMKKWFPKYNSSPDAITDDMVRDLIKEAGADKPDPETGKWKYSPKNGRWRDVQGNSYEELFSKLKRKLVNIANNKINLTQTIKGGLKEAIKDENPYYEFVRDSIPEDPEGVTGWFRNRMSKYCNSHWEVVDCEAAEYLGCILVRNKENNQIDVVKITTSIPDRHLPLIKGRSKLTAMFEDDRTALKKQNSLIADGLTGNIELMEAMLVLNNIPQLFEENAVLGEVSVYNPLLGGKGLSMPNEQLLYCFNELDNFESVGKNNFKNSKIKVSNYYDIFFRRFKEIVYSAQQDKSKKRFAKFTEAVSVLDKLYGNPIELRLQLLKLRDEFRNTFREVDRIAKYDNISQPQVEIFRMLEMAIGELDGINFTQITKTQKGLLSNLINNLNINNPGTLNNPMLDKLTSLVTTAYQNVRDTDIRYLGEIRKKVNSLKTSKNFSYLKERTIGNQADLYKRMIRFTDDGEILLKNPDDPASGLSAEERDFLSYFLNIVNHNRYKDKTEEELEEMKLMGSDDYFRLPLMPGNMASIASHKGLLTAIKDKFQDWNPKQIKKRMKEKIEGFMDSTDQKYEKASVGELWEMTNMFDAGENKLVRDKLIQDKGTDFFEYNLERLLLKHITAYSMKENLDLIFPTLQSIAIHISDSGMAQNTEYVDELDYLLKYIKNKIFNISLVDENSKVLYGVTQKLMGAASKLALAFNPHQYYQYLDQIWKDISLVIRKPDGSQAFTKQNMLDSMKAVGKDMLRFGNNLTLCEWINSLYGINDMDMNTYSEKLKSDQTGFWNFWSLAYRTSSRPDYYSRMTIFGAQMRGDGCWDAHSIVDGKLVYDWKKDKRFDAYANNRVNDPKYKQQQALYYTIAQQMVKEHTRNSDGSLFKVGDALPKAYTVQQAESNKALADSIYGYYSHEKKSLIQSTFIGSLLFQMNTYFSSKKNQFLAPEGIKLQGRYVQLEKDGVKYFHKLNENGEITPDVTTEDTGFPFYVWEGRWEEGILNSCWQILKGSYQNGFKEGNIREGLNYIVNDIWNAEDEQLRKMYRSNLGQLLYDLLMLLFVGTLGVGALTTFVNEDVKNRGNDTFESAAVNTAMRMSVRMLDASTDDFNFFKAIFGRGMQWTPFSIQTLNRTVETFSNVVSGDKSLYQGLINSVAATRATKPFWDYIDPTKEE